MGRRIITGLLLSTAMANCIICLNQFAGKDCTDRADESRCPSGVTNWNQRFKMLTRCICMSSNGEHSPHKMLQNSGLSLLIKFKTHRIWLQPFVGTKIALNQRKQFESILHISVAFLAVIALSQRKRNLFQSPYCCWQFQVSK